MPLNPRIVNAPNYPIAVFNAKKEELRRQGKTIVDFGRGDPIEPTAPFIREAVTEGVPVVSQYPHSSGLPVLKKACSGYLQRRFGVNVAFERELVVTGGSKEAIFTMTLLLVDPTSEKRVVIGPEPAYPVMERSAAIAGGEYYPIPLTTENQFLLDLSTLPEQLLQQTAAVWLNYPHNPTGVQCSLEYLAKQVEVAKRYAIPICSDECYIDLYFKEPAPSILEVTTQGVLAFHSCSKRSGMTAYRVGFIAGDAKIIGAYAKFRDVTGTTPPIYSQSAALVAWNDDNHVAERREIFSAKHRVFTDCFDAIGAEYVPSTATFFLWLKAPRELTGDTFAEKLLEAGMLVIPGSALGKSCGAYVRFALVPSLDECRDAAQCLAELSTREGWRWR